MIHVIGNQNTVYNFGVKGWLKLLRTERKERKAAAEEGLRE